MSRIHDLSHQEKPKERLLTYGAQSLSNTELLAILINTGRIGCSSLDIASHLLSQYKTLIALKNLTLVELTSVKGIGQNKAVTLMAAFELSRRMFTERHHEQSEAIQSPDQVAALFDAVMKSYNQEHFIVLVLNTKHQIIHKKTLFIGTLNSAVIHPREVFSVAVKWSAHAIIVVHNHPSGDPTPSPADIQTTKRLVVCGEAMGIDVLDHIVIGDGRFVSIMSDYEIED
ncbi:DNA repair protein RadC [Staphylococcus sp. 17KM0847]|uniref:RadC family protein n=1 Tax=Staphylococcus sp. 17KM0847 TaxID=2583989 RepID=UPI0015DCC6DA|nr:DNA repair protein RadC [Staphylococcus sp. 17KM0847]QLK85975.1 JAB domain-containing protein [Staphylococcus sp. 17KM0847]